MLKVAKIILILFYILFLSFSLAQISSSKLQKTTVNQSKVQILEISPSIQVISNANSEITLCVNALNTDENNVKIEASLPSIKIEQAASQLEIKANLFSSCEINSVKQKEIILIKQQSRQFKLKFIIISNEKNTVTGTLRLNETSKNANSYTRIDVPFVIPARVNIWGWETFGAYFFGSLYMIIASGLTVVVFVGLFLAFWYNAFRSGRTLKTVLGGRIEWKLEKSILTNLTTAAGLINLAAILQLFSDIQPTLLSIQQYGVLTVIFASFALLAGTMLSSSSKSQISLTTYFLSNAFIMSGVSGQLILLVYLLIEAYQLTWIAGVLLLIALLVGVALFFILISYTIQKTLDDTITATPGAPPVVPITLSLL